MFKSFAGALALGLCGILLGSAKGATLNSAYLVPGGSVKLNRQAIAQSKFCALTFDDGPDGVYTPQVAAVLERYGVPATFFVIGQRAVAHPDTVLALSRAGHEIGNHSWAHPDFTKLGAADRKSQIIKTQNALLKIGVTPRWFRPPYGAFDKSVVKSCQGCGLRPVLWSVDPMDCAQPGAAKIESRVLGGAGNGGVILLHSTNPQTVAALPGIIEKLRARGFTFVTMSQWELAAAGKALPQPPASPTGEPPSFREIEGLPEAPIVPGAGPGLLAVAEITAEETQAADPKWVAAMAPELESVAAPAEVEQEASAESTENSGHEPTLPVSNIPLYVFGNFREVSEAEVIFKSGAGRKLQRSR